VSFTGLKLFTINFTSTLILLTISCHASQQTLLISTHLAVVPRHFVYDTTAFSFASITFVKTLLHSPTKKTLSKTILLPLKLNEIFFNVPDCNYLRPAWSATAITEFYVAFCLCFFFFIRRTLLVKSFVWCVWQASAIADSHLIESNKGTNILK